MLERELIWFEIFLSGFALSCGISFPPVIPTMKILILTLALVASFTSAQEYLEIAANPGGAGQGKTVVLVAGDEEYRTEETMPMLAKILAKTHGFNCIVLFSTDEKAGYIDPNNQKSIRGTEVLDNADLMIIGTRFRQLPDNQLAPFARFLNAGKPVIGIRTATKRKERATGQIHVYDGAGKGKSQAALGVVLRSLGLGIESGADTRILLLQFLKGAERDYDEDAAIAALKGSFPHLIDRVRTGRSEYFGRDEAIDFDRAEANRAVRNAERNI